MELYAQILCETIIKDVIAGLETDREKLVEMKCFQTICKIYDILNDDQLEDAECFRRIENIVCAMEELGIGGGCRHDF